MLKRIIYVGCALALYAAAPFLHELGVGGTAVWAAEQSKNGEEKRETRRVPAMSEATYKKLSEAQEAVEAKDYAKATDVLNEMLDHKRSLNGNEIGQIYNILGFVYYSKEDYGKAIDAYKNVLAQGEDIPSGLEVQTIYTLAQLSFVNDDYKGALRYMKQWITKADNPGPEPYIFMGQVYYQMNDYPSATKQIEKGIAIAKNATRRSRSSGGRCSTTSTTSRRTGRRPWRRWKFSYGISRSASTGCGWRVFRRSWATTSRRCGHTKRRTSEAT